MLKLMSKKTFTIYAHKHYEYKVSLNDSIKSDMITDKHFLIKFVNPSVNLYHQNAFSCYAPRDVFSDKLP